MTASHNPAGRPRSEQINGKLHNALWKLLRKRDYDELTMEAIAEAAGVSRPALYRRYSDLGQLTPDALLKAGSAALPMPNSENLEKDICLYLSAVAASLAPLDPIGKALRGVLARALIKPEFAGDFAAFIRLRREPLRLRLQQAMPSAAEQTLDSALDQLFGPVLYRLLVRQIPVHQEQIEPMVDTVLGTLRQQSPDKQRHAG